MGRADGPLRFRDGHLRFAAQDLRNAEIGDLHPALFVNQNILRLDVAVHNALVMGELERLADLRDDLQRLARGQLARPLQLPQVQAVHEFHDEVRQPVHLAEFVDGHDVGMGQFGQRARFAIEPLDKTRAARGLRRKNFQRDERSSAGWRAL